LMNTVFLYIYGNLIEMLLWKKLYLLFFVLSTVIVTATITIFSSAPTIGLSGFTVALLAFLFMGLRSTNHPEAKAAWLFLIINILAWLYQHVSFSWHFGWAIAGVVFYILLQLIHLKRR
jgi:membrane associated rhomboid family serine protease